jgi:cytochrome o ubiquinol oxidase operon protein cyoD
MSENSEPVKSIHSSDRRKVMTYVVGYILSIYLTLNAYLIVTQHSVSRLLMFILIVVLALVQFIVQLLFFLHLGTETKPRWKLFVFVSMIFVVSILVFGSLWIMKNLNYRMAPTTQQTNNYMNNQDAL